MLGVSRLPDGQVYFPWMDLAVARCLRCIVIGVGVYLILLAFRQGKQASNKDQRLRFIGLGLFMASAVYVSYYRFDKEATPLLLLHLAAAVCSALGLRGNVRWHRRIHGR